MVETQAAFNTARAEARKAMSPTEVVHMDAIEQAAGILEAAQVPFLLWGSAEDGEKLEHPFDRGWYQFNRMSYLEPRYSNADLDNAALLGHSLHPKLMKHQSLLLGKDRAIVVIDAEGKALIGWCAGETIQREQMGNKPTEATQ